MTIQVEFWHLVGLLIGFFGFVFAAARLLGGQIDRRLEERFKAQDKARADDMQRYKDLLDAHSDEEARRADQGREVDRSFDAYRRAQETRVVDISDRVARVEQALSNVVNHNDLAKLHERINGVGREMSTVAGEMKGMNDTLRLILNRIAERGMP